MGVAGRLDFVGKIWGRGPTMPGWNYGLRNDVNVPWLGLSPPPE